MAALGYCNLYLCKSFIKQRVESKNGFFAIITNYEFNARSLLLF